MKRVMILITMVISLVGCTTLQETKVDSPQVVANVTEVTNIEYNLINIFPGQGLTVGFDDAGRIFGYSGLNRYFGKADIKDGRIVVDPLASTKMGGSREALIREDQFLTLLKSMTKISKTEDKLILTNTKGEQLIFSK
ncbi:META domain-containing protein [Fusobacterium mortiferum]|uniref:META domain-containing protein n=1 Tax=Fusobacterium mortiferum TaxID=850 RepID=UPI00195CA5EF|nr:META domain-containing protein [Fusobacterium mortiferum]